jgi:hypothetical protein
MARMSAVIVGTVLVICGQAAHAGGLSFVDCSEAQRKTVAEAVLDAGELTRIGSLYMTGDLDKEHTEYERWFGSYEDPPPMMAAMMKSTGCGAQTPAKLRRETIRNNVRNIYLSFVADDVIVDCSGTIVLKPEEPEKDCRSNRVVAFVDRNATFMTIYLCSPFWLRGSGNYDSQAGSIIHEVSHFRRVAYTIDAKEECNSFSCPNLAYRDPDLALTSAIHYQYFFESRPEGVPQGCLIAGGGGSDPAKSWVLFLSLAPLGLLALRRLGRRPKQRRRQRR